MFFNTRFFVLVLIIVFSLWKVSESSKPIISSSQEKVTYKGKNLEITCNSTRIKFIYSNTIKDEINTSTPTMIDTEENGIYKFVFQRLNTVFGDTGWHGCANYNVDIIPNSYDNPEVNWIYVYVKSSTHFFVEADISAHLRAIVGNDLAVPCRTTSREIIPVLYVHDDEETEKPFDLRISFRFKSLTLKDSDWYKCSIEKDGILHKVNYVLFVDQILPEPIIDDGTLHHVIRGENLHVNCTVQVETSMRYTFDWITPQQNNSRIQIHHFRKDLDENNLEVTRQLTILNVTNEDEGEYECFIRSGYKKKTTRNITIHDIRKRYINLTSQHPVKLYQQGIGSSVEWVVFFYGYPKPICLEWYKHNYKLVGEDNYSINTSSTFTIFKIKSLRKMDEGVYTLVAENHYITKKLNFALKVIDKPIPTLENIKFYYAPNENAEFHCTSLSYVFSNITWNFLKCIDFPSCKNSTTIQLTNANLKSEGSFMLYKRFTSKVKMPIEISGKITCVACNAVGCDVSVSSIFVSDGIGNFSIIGPKELVIKGDDVEFTCVASVSYYTDKLKWENSNKTLLAESERLHIKQHKTLFSHRSTVKINNVQKSDAMAYICVGESTSLDTIADETYELVVHDPVRPFFHETNMNETEVRDIDRIADDYSTLTLKCFVNGMPKPNVTWYKDNTTLKENDQYSFKSDHQELYIKYLKQNDYGKYLCRATNRFDTNETYQQIRITNISAIDNFSIIGPKESVIKGDKVSKITCVASISYYTDELTWANLNKTKRLRIVQNNTLFTYRSTLEIVNVQESDAKDYTCVGKYISNNVTFLQTRRYELVVHDPVSPFFYKTNMNETIARDIEMIPGRNETVTLQCFAKGMPIPIMAWFKDNTLLEENDQYSFKSNYQELNIKHLDKYNGGKYLCRATNRFGSKETYQLIIIKSVKIEEQKPDVILAISIAVLGIISMILAIFITIKVRREKKLKRELMEAGLMHFVDGALECLNPDLTIDEQAELLPYDKKFEFPRGRLKLGKQLGSGAFGVVMKAEALGICKNEMVTTVAVKIVRRTTDLTYIRALSNELKIMIHLGKHLNVVNLLGACTKNIFKHELLVIVEYCCFGNLQNYLLKHRTNFINQIDSKTGKIVHNIGTDILTKTANVNSNNSFDLNSDSDTATRYCSKTVNTDYKETSCSTDGYIFSDNSSQPDWRSNYRGDYKDQNFKPICTQDLLSWAFQIARGMEYLSQRKVLHGDLAARNILLTEDNVVKICDFGLAKSMYKDGNYKKKGDGPLPIKWMAIESMKDYIFSTQSDVWSFGIMLWEFFTLAETPYPGIEVEKLYQKLIEGYRMEQPEYAFREVYDIMLQCWKAEPTLRPDFTNLVESIGNLIEENMKSHYINLNIPYMNMNAIILESGKTDYLTMLSAPDHATLSSSSQDNVNTPLSEDASNSAYLCMSPGFQTDKSLIFSPTPHQDTSELPPSASNLEGTLKLSPVKQTDEIKSTEQFNVEQIDSKSNDYASSVIRTSNNYVNMSKQKSDLSKNMPDCFNNPNYVMQNNREIDQTISI